MYPQPLDTQILRALPKAGVLSVPATCDFVYAMYPHGFRFQGFRRTGLPIKRSTHIQAQRPFLLRLPKIVQLLNSQLDIALAQPTPAIANRTFRPLFHCECEQ
jgi:hypothetical protein